MPFVVTSDCHKCKYTDCVDVCPVDCFYELETMLVIHPDECIDCGMCEPECPVNAIFLDDELPEKEQIMIEFNAIASGAEVAASPPFINSKFPNSPEVLDVSKDALPNADKMNYDKSNELKRYYGVG